MGKDMAKAGLKKDTIYKTIAICGKCMVQIRLVLPKEEGHARLRYWGWLELEACRWRCPECKVQKGTPQATFPKAREEIEAPGLPPHNED